MNERNQFEVMNSIKFDIEFSPDEDFSATWRISSGAKYALIAANVDTQKRFIGIKSFPKNCTKYKYDESPTSISMFD